MSYIPDCRHDENYNEKFLNDKDKEFIRGFDWCVEMAVDNFFANEMFDLQSDDSYLGHILNEKLPESMQEEYEIELEFAGTGDKETETRKVETYADLIRSKILEWIENERDELITSMIDNMSEEEYEKNKQKAYEEDK